MTGNVKWHEMSNGWMGRWVPQRIHSLTSKHIVLSLWPHFNNIAFCQICCGGSIYLEIIGSTFRGFAGNKGWQIGEFQRGSNLERPHTRDLLLRNIFIVKLVNSLTTVGIGTGTMVLSVCTAGTGTFNTDTGTGYSNCSTVEPEAQLSGAPTFHFFRADSWPPSFKSSTLALKAMR